MNGTLPHNSDPSCTHQANGLRGRVAADAEANIGVIASRM